jgi:hypothetical protein
MLSPRYLDGLSDEIADIYAQLETDILQDMARRIARLGKVTETTKWQAQLLAETGALKKTVTRLLKKYDPAIQREIKAIYDDALIKNARADNRIFNEALGHGVSDINAQVMLASIQKTHSDLSRLTITTAYTTEQQFVQQANAAYMQVVTGAFSYDDAMKNACDNLARDGITGVQYRNGKPTRLSIESAVRMNVLTGVNQTASAMTMNNCEKLGCTLVETTAHIGARPSHEEWQGQIFSLSGRNKKYRPFSVCGLGTVDGICGINCRHSYYPYFEGLEKHYTEQDLDDMEKQTVEYNGKTYTRYDAEEKLRAIERNIRKYKRQALTQEAGGVDNTAARVKIGEWQAKAADFTKQTGIERDRVREFIGTVNGKQPRAILPKTVTTPKPIAAVTGGIAKGPVSEDIIKKTEEMKAALLDNNPMGGYGNMKSEARKTAERQNIVARTVYAHSAKLSESDIIKYIAGADKTRGSCSSAANAYIANKAGFNVLDFRGGESMDLFSKKKTSIEMAKFSGVESYITKNTNDFTSFNKLKLKMQVGKEYKLGLGRHAAIVRKLKNGTYQYLELQDEVGLNGFKDFGEYTLKNRFGCKKSHTLYGLRYEVAAYLIEIESLGRSKEFIELMQYLNTAAEAQLIGAGGHTK